jgi:hypothetical protein
MIQNKKYYNFIKTAKFSFFAVLMIVYCINIDSRMANAGAFDSLSLNARPTAMGEAFTAVGGGLDSVNYNPAGLSEAKDAQLLCSYRDFYGLDLVNQKYMGVVFPEKTMDFGFSWHRIGTSDNVEFLEYNEDLYTLTISRKMGVYRNIYGGVNFKYFRVFSDSNASGYGVDIGAQYCSLDGKTGFGIVNRNIGNATLHWDTGAKDILKSEIICGFNYMPAYWTSFTLDYGSTKKLNMGSELTFFDEKLGVRGGIRDLAKSNKTLAYGMSYNAESFQLDYALSKHYDLGVTHFFTLKLRLKRGYL